MYRYLNERSQKTNVNFYFWEFRNVYVNDIFFFFDKAFLRNYVDELALYSIPEKHILNQSIFKKKITYLQK